MSLGKHFLRDLDAGGAHRRDAGNTASPDRPALGQPLAGERGLGREGRPRRKALSPLALRAEVDVDEVRTRIEAEAEETPFAGTCSKATGLWFDMAMSKASPSRRFERFAPPTARLGSGLR